MISNKESPRETLYFVKIANSLLTSSSVEKLNRIFPNPLNYLVNIMSGLKVFQRRGKVTSLRNCKLQTDQVSFGKLRFFSGNLARSVVVTPGWYRVNRKLLAIAGILLIVALVLPVVAIVEEQMFSSQYINKYRPDLSDQTAVTEYLRQLQGTQNFFLTVFLVVEVVLAIAFILVFWFAIKQPIEKHPTHEHPEHESV